MLLAVPVLGADAKQALFERVFGDAVRLDPATVERVKAMKPGERLFIDRDGDGKNDEVWFIDTAVRHTDDVRPLLVRAIDEDGDLDAHMSPDLDSDLYVVDWKADGVVDVVLDYQDNDGDNDLDEMGFYFYMPSHSYFGKDVLRVWWGRDDGDDNLLWYDVNYTYYQNLCQYRCHFSGDESFVAFGLLADSEQWISAFENPFLFYDPDGDRCSEVVLRIEGHDDEVRRIRYSFDVDDDAYGRRTHDYDFSITAVAAEGEAVRLPEGVTAGTTLRGLPTQRWLQREPAQQFVIGAAWEKVLLTWDEMNANTEANVERDPNERWEGILNHKSEHFPQVGGPPCSPLNKRNEVSLKPTSPMRLYYDPTDRRLHLKGAGEGWLHVDYDFDGRIDAKYEYVDTDQDGYFDRRRLDLDADGEVDFDWPMAGPGAREFELDFGALSAFYKPVLAQVLADSQAFIDAAAVALSPDPLAGTPASAVLGDPAATFFLEKVALWMPSARVGERMRKTPAGARFYLDLVRDRAFKRLHERFGGQAGWMQVEAVYALGDYRAAAEFLTSSFVPLGRLAGAAGFRSFTHRIPIQINNTGGPQRDDWPVTLKTADILVAAPDFNSANCAVVAPQRWLDWRQVPHQVDEIDPAAGPEISFLVDVPTGGTQTWYIYYSPDGAMPTSFARKTGTAEDWVPPNIGWESNRCAYRAYWGQFDFFGKKTDQLIYDNIGAKSYHSEVEWGIDALHVGKACGLGGLAVYAGGQGYRVQNPAGDGQIDFKKRVLTQGPVRAAIEITAGNIIPGQAEPTVRMLCIIYAERQESEIRAIVSGADGDVLLAPGIVKLPRERFFEDREHGCFGSWGWQEVVIDEIGMGLIVLPQSIVGVVDEPDERRIQCRLDADGLLRYWIIGDWRRGRQHPGAPTIDNWRQELAELAGQLLNDVMVEIGAGEVVVAK